MESGYIHIFGLSVIFNYPCDLDNLLPHIIESSLQLLSKILYAFHVIPILATCPAHHNLCFTTINLLGNLYNPWISILSINCPVLLTPCLHSQHRQPHGYHLSGSLCQQVQQLLMIHVIQCVNINAKRIGNTHHVKPEWLKKFNEVHFLSSKWVGKPGAGVVTLWPWASLYEVVRTTCRSSPQSGSCFCNSAHIIITSSSSSSFGLWWMPSNRISPSCFRDGLSSFVSSPKRNAGCICVVWYTTVIHSKFRAYQKTVYNIWYYS